MVIVNSFVYVYQRVNALNQGSWEHLHLQQRLPAWVLQSTVAKLVEITFKSLGYLMGLVGFMGI